MVLDEICFYFFRVCVLEWFGCRFAVEDVFVVVVVYKIENNIEKKVFILI